MIMTVKKGIEGRVIVVVVVVVDGDDGDDDNDNIICCGGILDVDSRATPPSSPTLCGFPSFLLQFPDHIPICSSVFYPHTSYRGN